MIISAQSIHCKVDFGFFINLGNIEEKLAPSRRMKAEIGSRSGLSYYWEKFFWRFGRIEVSGKCRVGIKIPVKLMR